MKTFLIVLLCLFSSFAACGQKKIVENRQSKIPKGWKLVDLDSFSFFLPQSMKDKKVSGIDSSAWYFKDAEMELLIDSGMYTNDFQDLKNSYEVKEEFIKIDSKDVRYFTWDRNKYVPQAYVMTENGSNKPRKTFKRHFAVGIYFSGSSFQQSEDTNFSISTKTLEKQEIAKMILQSIKFKD